MIRWTVGFLALATLGAFLAFGGLAQNLASAPSVGRWLMVTSLVLGGLMLFRGPRTVS